MDYTEDGVSPRAYCKELHEELQALRHEMTRVKAAMRSIQEMMIARCDFEVGDKVRRVGIHERMFITHLHVAYENGEPYVSAFLANAEEKEMPEDLEENRIKAEQKVADLKKV